MDILNERQLWGLVLFFLGNWVLSLCTRLEKVEEKRLKDPKVRWAVLGQKKIVFQYKNTRGIVMTLSGATMAIWGFCLILLNIPV